MDNVSVFSIAGQSYGPSFSLFNITVTFGRASSPGQGHGEVHDLVVPWHDLPENPSIFSLLSWHTRTSEFKGRDEELAELLRWAKDSRRISMKFITGPGGVGTVDLWTFTTVAVSLIGVVLLASYVPARRAASVAPTEALRWE